MASSLHRNLYWIEQTPRMEGVRLIQANLHACDNLTTSLGHQLFRVKSNLQLAIVVYDQRMECRGLLRGPIFAYGCGTRFL